MPDEMTEAEARASQNLIAGIRQLISGHQPSVIAHALVNVLASLARTYAAESPAVLARQLADTLVDCVERPLESKAMN